MSLYEEVSTSDPFSFHLKNPLFNIFNIIAYLLTQISLCLFTPYELIILSTGCLKFLSKCNFLFY